MLVYDDVRIVVCCCCDFFGVRMLYVRGGLDECDPCFEVIFGLFFCECGVECF